MLEFPRNKAPGGISSIGLILWIWCGLLLIILLALPFLVLLDYCEPNADGSCTVIERGFHLFSLALMLSVPISLMVGLCHHLYQRYRGKK